MKLEWDGGTLTKKRALFICYHLWMWLWQNPSKNKDDWPEWAHNGGKVRRVRNDCPCCQYGGIMACMKDCLLGKYWTNQNCLDKGEYSRWDEAKTLRTRKKYALKIANFAKTEYLRIGGKL